MNNIFTLGHTALMVAGKQKKRGPRRKFLASTYTAQLGNERIRPAQHSGTRVKNTRLDNHDTQQHHNKKQPLSPRVTQLEVHTGKKVARVPSRHRTARRQADKPNHTKNPELSTTTQEY